MLPLKEYTAAELRDFSAGKMPNAHVFNVPEKTANMLQADLADANISYVENGLYADFHALRHTTGSWLAANNVHPKVIQSIMRHSKIELTMSVYTHTLTGQEPKAIASLPDLSLPSSKQKAVATGTDGKAFDAAQKSSEKLTPKLTPFLTPTAYPECNQSATVGNSTSAKPEKPSNHNPLQDGVLGTKKKALSASDTDKAQARPKGLEPSTFGSTVRCSSQLSYGPVISIRQSATVAPLYYPASFRTTPVSCPDVCFQVSFRKP